MLVRELIEELSKLDPDLEIQVESWDDEYVPRALQKRKIQGVANFGRPAIIV